MEMWRERKAETEWRFQGGGQSPAGRFGRVPPQRAGSGGPAPTLIDASPELRPASSLCSTNYPPSTSANDVDSAFPVG